MNTKELIGLRIKRLRRDRKLSQEELAEKVEISPKYVSSIERGKENPTLDILIKLAKALSVEIEDIFRISHEGFDIKRLRDSVDHLLREADEEKLRMVAKILRAVLR